MDEKKLKALAAELAKDLKTEADLNAFSRMLTKLTVETELNVDLTDHLGHEKNAPKTGSNTRNGYSSKTVLCDDGEIELNTPRDRENTFKPQLIKKHQTRITQMDNQILSLYAKGMTTREIVATFKEMYDADVLSPTHFPPKNKSWKDIIKSTKTGPAKYKPDINIKSVEYDLFNSGTPVTNGKPWKVKDMGEVIGASEGKPSQWMRVELSAGTIHGHPISIDEFLRLTTP